MSSPLNPPAGNDDNNLNPDNRDYDASGADLNRDVTPDAGVNRDATPDPAVTPETASVGDGVANDPALNHTYDAGVNPDDPLDMSTRSDRDGVDARTDAELRDDQLVGDRGVDTADQVETSGGGFPMWIIWVIIIVVIIALLIWLL